MPTGNPAFDPNDEIGTRAMMAAQGLTDRSITHNEIAHADYSDALAAALAVQCDDSVDAGAVVEYWGTDDAKNEWRVHLDRRARE